MADGQYLAAHAEADVQRAVLAALRADPGVQAIFGDPARIYDDETRGPAYPFAVLERHETRPSNSSCVAGAEHTLTLAVTSRHGGRSQAREALGALRAAIEGTDFAVANQVIVLAYPTYGDVFRTRDQQTFRSILRVRIISEEAA